MQRAKHRPGPYRFFFCSAAFLSILLAVCYYRLSSVSDNQRHHGSRSHQHEVNLLRPRGLQEVDTSAQVTLALCIVGSIVLAMCSALFSGLTLGLMTLDVTQLRILMEVVQSMEKEGSFHAPPQRHCACCRRTKPSQGEIAAMDAVYAKRIMKVRRDGNLLLVTLLVGNVAVNSGFSILLNSFTSGILSFTVSTVVITLFGEIVPQAICSRHGLVIGYYALPLVVVIETLLYVVCKPIALLLDLALGEDIGTIYSKKQLEALVKHHEIEGKILNNTEANIVRGGLVFSSRSAESIMTPMVTVFGLGVDQLYDLDLASTIISRGFSRLPVLDSSRVNDPIVGVLHAKDLLLVDPGYMVPVKVLLRLFGRPVLILGTGSTLGDVLAEFKRGKTHFAIVREVVESPSGLDNYYLQKGIVTLEDVMEEILQDEVYDEFDETPHAGAADNEQPSQTFLSTARKGKAEDTSVLSTQKLVMRLRLIAASPTLRHPTPEETQALCCYLRASTECFAALSKQAMESLIRSSYIGDATSAMPRFATPPGSSLCFCCGYATDYVLLVLHGSIELSFDNGTLTEICRPWNICGLNGILIEGWISDCSARLSSDAEVLIIRRVDFVQVQREDIASGRIGTLSAHFARNTHSIYAEAK